MKTDYVDLYQLHWPDRKANFFGKLGYVHQKKQIISTTNSTRGFGRACKSRRFVGLSNETSGINEIFGIS